jgi:hypothetical protein
MGKVAQHLLDVGKESHVQHPVRFVQHQVLDARQRGVLPGEMVEQPARGRDHDIHATPERMLLGPHADTAVNGRAGERSVNRKVVQILEDLRGQLPGGRQHQRTSDPARLGS